MNALQIIADFADLAGRLSASEIASDHRAAEIITTWLAGAEWDAAAGLAEGWRHVQRRAQAHACLHKLAIVWRPTSEREFARRLAREMTRANPMFTRYQQSDITRPHGDRGLLFDLMLVEHARSESGLRKIINGLSGPTTGLFSGRGAA